MTRTIGMREVSFTVSSTIVVRVEVTPGTAAICGRSIWPEVLGILAP